MTDLIHVPDSEVDPDGDGEHAGCNANLWPVTVGGPDDVTCPDCLDSFAFVFPGAPDPAQARMDDLAIDRIERDPSLGE